MWCRSTECALAASSIVRLINRLFVTLSRTSSGPRAPGSVLSSRGERMRKWRPLHPLTCSDDAAAPGYQRTSGMRAFYVTVGAVTSLNGICTPLTSQLMKDGFYCCQDRIQSTKYSKYLGSADGYVTWSQPPLLSCARHIFAIIPESNNILLFLFSCFHYPPTSSPALIAGSGTPRFHSVLLQFLQPASNYLFMKLKEIWLRKKLVVGKCLLDISYFSRITQTESYFILGLMDHGERFDGDSSFEVGCLLAQVPPCIPKLLFIYFFF